VACPARPAPQPPLRLADVLRRYVPAKLSGAVAKVIGDIISCRTIAQGGRLWSCNLCGHEIPLYNSCLNRHCPTCQGAASVRWVNKRLADLLPVPYFHLVFTIPPHLHAWFRRCPRTAYAQIMAAAAETTIDVCRRNLGVTPGVICVLHTWTQQMLFHPHVHVIVTGGGLSLDGERWIASRERFLVPVRRLSPVFRAKLLERVARHSHGGRAPKTPKEWVVYCKPPMVGPEQVLRYLGRYTHRVAISDRRILKLDDGHVTFSYRNRKLGKRCRWRLPIDRFVELFLMHLLPKRFVRIRYHGLLANGSKAKRLAKARALLDAPAPPEPQASPDASCPIPGLDSLLCPKCRQGILQLVADVPAPYRGVRGIRQLAAAVLASRRAAPRLRPP
jgi:hypothetical protein